MTGVQTCALPIYDPAVRAALEAQAMVVPRPQPLPAMNKVYGDNITRYRAIAKAINLQPE